MNKCTMDIWNRKFDLPLMYECYDGEEILDSQEEAVVLFKGNSKEVTVSLDQVKKYIRKTGAEQLSENEIDNVFRYVMPKSIFVPHRKAHLIVAIMCNYKFDEEHGIAVVFEGGKFKQVGPQDIVL